MLYSLEIQITTVIHHYHCFMHEELVAQQGQVNEPRTMLAKWQCLDLNLAFTNKKTNFSSFFHHQRPVLATPLTLLPCIIWECSQPASEPTASICWITNGKSGKYWAVACHGSTAQSFCLMLWLAEIKDRQNGKPSKVIP